MDPELTSPTTPGPEAAIVEGAAILPSSAERALIRALQQNGYETRAALALARSLSQLGNGQQILEHPGLLFCPVQLWAALQVASSQVQSTSVAASAAVLENPTSLQSTPAATSPSPLPLPLAASSGGAAGLPSGALVAAGAEDVPQPSPTSPLKAVHLRLQGSLGRGGHVLLINHTVRVELQLNQYLVVLLLCCHALSKAGLSSPLSILGGDYLKAGRIVKLIDYFRRTESGLRDLPALGTQEVHHAKWGLLKRLEKHGIASGLLESLRGSGYRLNIDPSSIVIILSDEDEADQVWGLT
jgi:hypothetical protein